MRYHERPTFLTIITQLSLCLPGLWSSKVCHGTWHGWVCSMKTTHQIEAWKDQKMVKQISDRKKTIVWFPMVSRFCVYPNNGLDSYRSVTVYTGTVLGPSSQLVVALAIIFPGQSIHRSIKQTSTSMCTGYQHITADTHTNCCGKKFQ